MSRSPVHHWAMLPIEAAPGRGWSVAPACGAQKYLTMPGEGIARRIVGARGTAAPCG